MDKELVNFTFKKSGKLGLRLGSLGAPDADGNHGPGNISVLTQPSPDSEAGEIGVKHGMELYSIQRPPGNRYLVSGMKFNGVVDQLERPERPLILTFKKVDVPASEKYWAQMNQAEQEAVEALGWSASSWDNGDQAPFEQLWSAFSAPQIDAATLIDYDETNFSQEQHDAGQQPEPPALAEPARNSAPSLPQPGWPAPPLAAAPHAGKLVIGIELENSITSNKNDISQLQVAEKALEDDLKIIKDENEIKLAELRMLKRLKLEEIPQGLADLKTKVESLRGEKEKREILKKKVDDLASRLGVGWSIGGGKKSRRKSRRKSHRKSRRKSTKRKSRKKRKKRTYRR